VRLAGGVAGWYGGTFHDETSNVPIDMTGPPSGIVYTLLDATLRIESQVIDICGSVQHSNPIESDVVNCLYAVTPLVC
jgi:hypothetical protein